MFTFLLSMNHVSKDCKTSFSADYSAAPDMQKHGKQRILKKQILFEWSRQRGAASAQTF